MNEMKVALDQMKFVFSTDNSEHSLSADNTLKVLIHIEKMIFAILVR